MNPFSRARGPQVRFIAGGGPYHLARELDGPSCRAKKQALFRGRPRLAAIVLIREESLHGEWRGDWLFVLRIQQKPNLPRFPATPRGLLDRNMAVEGRKFVETFEWRREIDGRPPNGTPSAHGFQNRRLRANKLLGTGRRGASIIDGCQAGEDGIGRAGALLSAAGGGARPPGSRNPAPFGPRGDGWRGSGTRLN